MSESLSAGQVFEVTYPFVRDTYEVYDIDGPFKAKTWRPGIRHEAAGPEDVEPVADAEGKMILTVVGTYKPGRFPTRVFFTRQFIDPKGRSFGKTKLHIVTAEKFRRLDRGYQHEYSVAKVLESA